MSDVLDWDLAALGRSVPPREPTDLVLPIDDTGLPGLRLRVRRDASWGGVEVLLEHGPSERRMEQIAALDLTTVEARWLIGALAQVVGSDGQTERSGR
jgi:hypothetical protein